MKSIDFANSKSWTKFWWNVWPVVGAHQFREIELPEISGPPWNFRAARPKGTKWGTRTVYVTPGRPLGQRETGKSKTKNAMQLYVLYVFLLYIVIINSSFPLNTPRARARQISQSLEHTKTYTTMQHDAHIRERMHRHPAWCIGISKGREPANMHRINHLDCR